MSGRCDPLAEYVIWHRLPGRDNIEHSIQKMESNMVLRDVGKP